jgi:hypothetical protein
MEHRACFADQDFLPAYRWLKDVIGFFPIFFSVGKNLHDLYMTGYNTQFCTYECWGFGNKGPRRRNQPNLVLFSFKNVTGVFTDFDVWEYFLKKSIDEPKFLKLMREHSEAKKYILNKLFKKNWTKKRWIEEAIECPYEVQLLSKTIDVRRADRVLCRNQATKEYLEEHGYKNIHILRIPSSHKELVKLEEK